MTAGNGCDIGVGSNIELSHTFSQSAVNDFAVLCGDNNPLHTDNEFAKTTMFGKTIVHGILVSSLFSTIFGRFLPGSIYVNQALKFRRPVFVGSPVYSKIEVQAVDIRRKGKLLTCRTCCYNDAREIVIEGEAQVLLP